MKLAIITDIHEDVEKLESALRKMENLKVDKIICLGDISGFSIPYYNYLDNRNAHKCISLIRKHCDITVLGNHDMFAAQILPQKPTLIDIPDNWYQLDYYQKKEIANGNIWLNEENDLNPLLTDSDKTFLQSLPEFHILKTDNLSILFSHYFYPNQLGFFKYFYTKPEELKQHFDFMKSNNCDISFIGHEHPRGVKIYKSKSYKQYIIKQRFKLTKNPCCVGTPPITRAGGAAFCLFNTENIKLQLVRI